MLFPWLCQYRMQCWTHYKHYSIGTAGTNGYLWESKYPWTIFGHDHRNSLFEGLTIDLTQPFISYWIRPVRWPILIILLYDLSPYPPYPEKPWLSVDLMRAQGIWLSRMRAFKNPHITEYVTWSLMPWCRSMWITRNRANPGNGMEMGSSMVTKGQLPSQHIENILKWPKRTFSNLLFSAMYSRLEQASTQIKSSLFLSDCWVW